jgi:hypothetical protein
MAATCPAARGYPETVTKDSPPCPRCRSRKVLRIRHGIGGPPTEGEWLGGCEIEPDAPDWRCSRCRLEWAAEPEPVAEPLRPLGLRSR